MARNGLLDLPEMKPTPRNQLYGFFADVLGGIDNYAQRPNPVLPMGKANPPLSLLSEFAGLPGLSRTLDRLSYGEPLTTGRGMTTAIRPDTLEAATAVLPGLAKFPRAALGAAGMMAGAADLGGAGRAMFIGPTAKTWDKAAAATAQKLEKAGAEPRAIWSETGTFKGPDGKWRQEIDDSGAMVNASGGPGSRVENDLKFSSMPDLNHGPAVGNHSLLDHPSLRDAYGSVVPNTFVRNQNTMLGNGPLGAYDEAADAITLFAPAKAQDARSTMLHELQHAIQQREGFARGGSPDALWPQFESELARLPVVKAQVEKARNQASSEAARAIANDPALVRAAQSHAANLGEFQATAPIQAQVQDYILSQTPGFARSYKELSDLERSSRIDPTERYRRLAGEAEARATQARMNMTPDQRRATFPYDSYDVPVNELIVRGLLAP